MRYVSRVCCARCMRYVFLYVVVVFCVVYVLSVMCGMYLVCVVCDV